MTAYSGRTISRAPRAIAAAMCGWYRPIVASTSL
jgi:hypothetical protein